MSGTRDLLTVLESSNGRSRASSIARSDRSLDWLSLLPRDTRISVGAAVSAALRRKLAAHSGAGAPTLVALRSPSASQGLDAYSAVVVIDPARDVPTLLDAHGFRHALRFVAIPSLDDPRILVPLGNRLVAVGSLDLLAPYRLTARLKKQALSGLTRLGFAHRAGDVILLARRQPTELERYLQAVTGQDAPLLALSPGAEGEFRKLTIGVIGEDGRALAFAKVGWTAGARDAIDREAHMLMRLARHPELRGQVPALLGANTVDGGLVSVQLAGRGKSSSSEYGAEHDAFLKMLAAASSRRMRFSDSLMWRSIQTMYAQIVPRLPRERRELLRQVVEEVDLALGARELDLSIAHRDFGPWNVRVQPGGRIFVFDWETAQPEMTPAYDYFDFQTRSHVLYGKQAAPAFLAGQWLSGCRRWHPGLPPAHLPALFLAYLLDRALSRSRYELWRGEAHHDPMLDLLISLLESRAAWMAAEPR